MIEPNTLHLGDCLEVMKEIPDGSVDMVLCDLPYGTTACKWDSVIPFESLWNVYNRVLKIDGIVALTASQPFTSALVMSNPKAFRYEWIWFKNRGTNPMCAKFQPLKRHESVLIFSRQKPRYFPQMRKGKPYRGFSSKTGTTTGDIYGNTKSVHRDNPEGILYPISVQEFACDIGLHPTQKPLALMEYLIKTYTNEGDLVLDNTMGSGTTCVAAKNLSRRFIGIEKNPKYYEIACNRLGISPSTSRPTGPFSSANSAGPECNQFQHL